MSNNKKGLTSALAKSSKDFRPHYSFFYGTPSELESKVVVQDKASEVMSSDSKNIELKHLEASLDNLLSQVGRLESLRFELHYFMQDIKKYL